LSREVPEGGKKWPQTCRGGPNGFYMIILTLAWWVAGADQNAEGFQGRGLIRAIDDVTWVVDNMILVLKHREKSAGMKHSLDIVAEDPLAKKR
jgi:hypothetical protein